MTEKELKEAMDRHPAGKKRIQPPRPVLIVVYKCCWHCGDDPQHEVDTHIVPCNEPGVCEGKEVCL